jgi:hypothetical protein
MSDRTGAFEQGSAERDLLNRENKERFQRIFNVQAVRSYLYLSFGMGVVALALPFLLVLAGGYDSHYSISFFYHVNDFCRDILVGCLCATGVFLFLFHGLSSLENWILNIAGAAAISVAMNPMASEQCARNQEFSIHGASAILFFLCLAVVAVGLSKGRIRYIIYAPERRRFKIAYNAAGTTMVFVPAIVAVIHHFLGGHECTHWIFWIECIGIWAFAFYWFVKTYEYRILLRIRLYSPQS